MIKKINVILAIVAVVLIMLIPAKSVLAKDKQILTMDATQANGKISVSGTTEDGALAVAIAIYNSDGSQFIKMITTSVDANNKYSGAIDIASGNYLVRVADYEGGSYLEKLLETEGGSTSVTSGPKTGDFLAIYVTIFVICVVTLAVVIKNRKKKTDKNN